MMISEKRYVTHILDENDSYPYSFLEMQNGISVRNTGSNTITIAVAGLSIPVPAGDTYDGNFRGFDAIDVSGSSTWLIEIRGGA